MFAIWGFSKAVAVVTWSVAILFVTSGVSGFNVDVGTASLRHGDQGSMFGFTVAQHVDRGQNWLVAF